jgi:hypothetical protein
MPRYNFDLLGARMVRDNQGMLFEDCLVAARFANKMATDLGAVQPELHGNASMVMTDQHRDDLTYCVAV